MCVFFPILKCQIKPPPGPQGPLIIAHRLQQLQWPGAAARGQYSAAFREKLRLAAPPSSHRHSSASLPLMSLFLAPSPFALFPLSLFFLLSSQARSVKSLQAGFANLRLLDAPERVPLCCPSASGALPKSSNNCWLRRGGRARGRACSCRGCRQAEHSGDEVQDDEDVVRVGSSAGAATHFSGEFNAPLTFLSL